MPPQGAEDAGVASQVLNLTLHDMGGSRISGREGAWSLGAIRTSVVSLLGKTNQVDTRYYQGARILASRGTGVDPAGWLRGSGKPVSASKTKQKTTHGEAGTIKYFLFRWNFLHVQRTSF